MQSISARPAAIRGQKRLRGGVCRNFLRYAKFIANPTSCQAIPCLPFCNQTPLFCMPRFVVERVSEFRRLLCAQPPALHEGRVDCNFPSREPQYTAVVT